MEQIKKQSHVMEQLEKTDDKLHIYLASGSPRRKEILEQAGVSFDILISEADENIDEESPSKMVKELSKKKAKAVYDVLKAEKKRENRLIIGADTVVAIDGKILGKPKDVEDAKNMIRMISGTKHQVFTGVALLLNRKTINFYVKSTVYVAQLSEKEIEQYVSTGESLDKAGAYAVQGRFAPYIEKIDGDYYNIMGLPVAEIVKRLKKEGIYIIEGKFHV